MLKIKHNMNPDIIKAYCYGMAFVVFKHLILHRFQGNYPCQFDFAEMIPKRKPFSAYIDNLEKGKK